MRSVLLIFALVFAGIIALSGWRPGAADLYPTPSITPLPDNYTILPTFEPSYPCEMQNAEQRVQRDNFCRYERVTESLLVLGDGVWFILHTYHMGSGCWSGINQDIRELHVCSRRSGERTIFTTELTSVLLPSPDGDWLLYGTMSIRTPGDIPLMPHVWRVRFDGTDLQELSTQGFPDGLVGAPLDLRWLDDDWVALRLWDAAGNEPSNYHAFRLKSDGSGIYEALDPEAAT
jgi:hypothetical protein